MKYKIFVCSSSGIEYLLHSSAIKSIPLELKTSNIEKYYESELDYNLFYSRAHLDKKMKLNVNKRTIDDIKDLISQYTNEETNIYILLSGFYNKDDAMALKNDNVFAFQYDLYGYVLSRMAITLEKSLKKNIDDLYLDMNSIKDRAFMIYSTPKKDMEFFYNDEKKKEISAIISNNLYSYIDKGIYNTKIINGSYNSYINRICSKEEDFIIEYTNSNSLYVKYFEEILINFFPEISIKKIQISPSFSFILNENAIGVGYIKNEEEGL